MDWLLALGLPFLISLWVAIRVHRSSLSGRSIYRV